MLGAFFVLPILFSMTPVQRSAPAAASGGQRVLTACNAVSRLEVEQALGRAVGRGVEESGRTQSTCDYEGRSGIVTITIHMLREELNLGAEIQNLKAALPAASMRQGPALGTRAFYLDLPQAGTQLHVVQGARHYVLVSVLGFGEAAEVSNAAESIARRVLGRL